MRSIKLFLIFLSFVTSLSLAQEKLLMKKDLQEKSSSLESYPIDPQPLLERFSKENGIDLTRLAAQPQQHLRKVAWSFTLGSPHSWYASDLTSGTSTPFYSVPSTCRAVGDNCYVFVEDSSWTNGRVNQDAVDSVRIAFDSRTPAGSVNPSKGIYQNDVDTFGNPPDVDHDPKIIILILNIKDGYSGTGGYVAGYFYGYNEFAQANSNDAEIYYLDCKPANLTTPTGLITGMQTTAHEFQHMIHFNYNRSQDTFLNESMSMCAEVVNGYSMRSQDSFNDETNHYLFDWRKDDNTKVLTDYARAARYSVYLYEQFGADILKKIVQAPLPGINGITYALQNVVPAPATTRGFSDVLDDWFVANSLNDKTVDTRFGYTNVAVGNAVARVHINPNVTNYSDGVSKYGAQYITFSSGSNLKINFDVKGNSYIKIKAIKYGAVTKVVEDVTAGVDYPVPGFGTTYNKVTFVVYESSQSVFVVNPSSDQLNFSYTSTGTFQNTPQVIAYDSTPPVGVYVLSIGDTVAVRFDGLLGMRLDSIRVALRNTAQIEGGIWKAGTTTFLGARLASFMVAGITTPPSPYPIPWTNWVKVDLRSSNIDASTNFIAGFIIDGVYENSSSPTNRVMHTSIPGTSAYHSYTYLHVPGGTSTPGWYFLGDGTNISLYLIRAYVSLSTGVKEEIELMPSSFVLSQNYPNPFNPETVIRYQLPEGSLVTLKVYDVLGREVTTLINEYQQPGVHNAKFSIQNSAYSSGVYFYRFATGNKVETKKMILLK